VFWHRCPTPTAWCAQRAGTSCCDSHAWQPRLALTCCLGVLLSSTPWLRSQSLRQGCLRCKARGVCWRQQWLGTVHGAAGADGGSLVPAHHTIHGRGPTKTSLPRPQALQAHCHPGSVGSCLQRTPKGKHHHPRPPASRLAKGGRWRDARRQRALTQLAGSGCGVRSIVCMPLTSDSRTVPAAPHASLVSGMRTMLQTPHPEPASCVSALCRRVSGTQMIVFSPASFLNATACPGGPEGGIGGWCAGPVAKGGWPL